MTRALIVDDDRDVCALVGYRLAQSGFDVCRAMDGEAALASVAAQLPDVALLDIMMPGLSGLEVLERWRVEPSTAHLAVLLLTAKAQESDVERGRELGADDYIVKPFSTREVVRRVNEVLACVAL